MTWGHKYWKERKEIWPKRSASRRSQATFRRDNWICQICYSQLDPNLVGKEVDEAPTIDHIIPLSKGGSNRRDNKQTACRKCNNEKGDNS
jgi:5-methylcytosine-specific restriction endonuclease McrA